MGGPRALPLLVAALCLAGCVNLGASQEPPAAKPRGATPLVESALPVALAPADAAPASASPYRIAMPEVWLRPYQGANASVDAPGARVSWYAGIPGAPVRVTLVAGVPYLGRDLLHNRTFGTDALQPRHAQGLRLASEGRYVFTSRQAPGLQATITVDSAAPQEDAPRIFLVGGEGEAYRAVPDALTVRPGAVVSFVNRANGTLDVVEREFLALVPTDDADITFHPVELGVYDLVALVHGGPRGDGEARSRFLVDFDRPANHAEFPPLEGQFAHPALDAGRAYAYNASLPIRTARIETSVRSSALSAPAPGAVRVRLSDDGKVVLDAVASQPEVYELRDLPPGKIVLDVEPASGAFVEYRVAGTLDMTLPVPDALKQGR